MREETTTGVARLDRDDEFKSEPWNEIMRALKSQTGLF